MQVTRSNWRALLGQRLGGDHAIVDTDDFGFELMQPGDGQCSFRQVDARYHARRHSAIVRQGLPPPQPTSSTRLCRRGRRSAARYSPDAAG